MGEGFPADIAARLFRALFNDWDLHEVHGGWVAVPISPAAATMPALPPPRTPQAPARPSS